VINLNGKLVLSSDIFMNRESQIDLWFYLIWLVEAGLKKLADDFTMILR
jgi:hypothetical protein